MSEFGYVTSVILGVIQGLTEFLPVSSSAHLALTQRWLALDAVSPQLLLFDVFVHVGTLGAVVIVFAGTIRRFAGRLTRELGRSPPRRRYACRICLLVIVATVPTAAAGLALQDFFEATFDKPRWIGAALCATGVFLAATLMVPRGSRGWKDFRWWQAALVGFAQALAIMPGISRSGATICVALFCGLRRRWTAEFSFLIAAPAILGAALIKTKDTLDLPAGQLANMPWGPLLIGSLVSTLTGVVALSILLKAVRRAKLHYFAIYCWLLAGLVFFGAPPTRSDAQAYSASSPGLSLVAESGRAPLRSGANDGSNSKAAR